MLSIVAMCVNNPDRSPLGTNGRDPAQNPSGPLEIVSDDLPVLSRTRAVSTCLQRAVQKPVQAWQSLRKMAFDKAKLFVPAVAASVFLNGYAAFFYPLLFPTTDSARQARRKSCLDCAGKEACSLAASDSLLPA
jgi:hypothetical protein